MKSNIDTRIRVPRELQNELKKFKKVERESYADVIRRLIGKKKGRII